MVAPTHTRTHVLRELGFVIERSGAELRGAATVRPEMFVPGTDCVRTSILATWTDLLCGLLTMGEIRPRVPVTLELDVHLYQPARDCGSIHAVGRTVKAGRSVVVSSVDFSTGDGEPLAIGSASFLAAPDASLRVPAEAGQVSEPPSRLLEVPLAERAQCARLHPGVAVQPRLADGLNASNTINGGLLALAAEEAALSLTPGVTLASLDIRYIRPMRIGPAVATATVRAGLGKVEVRDAGADDRLGAVATTRTF